MKRISWYNVKIIHSGQRCEIYKYKRAIMQGREVMNKYGRKGNDQITEKKTEQNRREVLNRARNKIIRLISCNEDMQTFITLTYRDNMQDLSTSKEHLHLTLMKLSKTFNDFKYLYVLEFQDRGAIHYHMLCNIELYFETAKHNQLKPKCQKDFENYFREAFWQHGFCDVRNLKSEGNTNIALYVSCYLVEDLMRLDLKGAKCYGYSRNLKKPEEIKTYTKQSPDEILIEASKNYECKYASSYDKKSVFGDEEFVDVVNYFDMIKKGEII